MTIHRSAIFTDAIVFTGSGSSTPCEKLNPSLLTLGQVDHDPGVKQEIVIIGFAAFDGVGGARFAVGDILLLGSRQSRRPGFRSTGRRTRR